MAVSEINYYTKIVKGDLISEENWYAAQENTSSVVFAYIICSLLIIFHLASILSWYVNRKTINVDMNCRTKELYLGLRKYPQDTSLKSSFHKNASYSESMTSLLSKVRIARLYPSLFLYRRT